MEKLLVDTSEYQKRVLDCIGSEEIDKFFGSTVFAGLPESNMCKQAMIHGMIIASMMTSQCNHVVVMKRPVGHWMNVQTKVYIVLCAIRRFTRNIMQTKKYNQNFARIAGQ